MVMVSAAAMVDMPHTAIANAVIIARRGIGASCVEGSEVLTAPTAALARIIAVPPRLAAGLSSSALHARTPCHLDVREPLRGHLRELALLVPLVTPLQVVLAMCRDMACGPNC